MMIFHIKNWFRGIEDLQLLLMFEWKEEYLGVFQMDQNKINWNQMLKSIH